MIMMSFIGRPCCQSEELPGLPGNRPGNYRVWRVSVITSHKSPAHICDKIIVSISM